MFSGQCRVCNVAPMFPGVDLMSVQLADKQAALGKFRQLRGNGVSHDLVKVLLSM